MTKIDGEKSAEILRLYRSGVGSTTIARKFGVSKKCVSLHLKKHGEPMRPLGERGRKYALYQDAFSVDSPEVRYWVGALLTDGCVYVGKPGTGAPKIIFVAHWVDYEWVDALRGFLRYGGPISKCWRVSKKTGEKIGPYARLAVSSAKLASDLARFGVVPRKTNAAAAPAELAYCADFWRGAVDGDGSLNTERVSVSLTGKKPLCQQFADLCLRVCGHSPPLQYGEDDKGSWWSVSVTARNAFALMTFLYGRPGPRMHRKGSAAAAFISRSSARRWRASPTKPSQKQPTPGTSPGL